MSIPEDVQQVLNLAVKRAELKGNSSMMVQTMCVVEMLGGSEILPAADRERYQRTPEKGRSQLTSNVAVAGIKKLLGEITNSPSSDV